MPDREKVIRELETLGAWHTHHYAPFHYEAAETIHDAIALLREQEALAAHQRDEFMRSWRTIKSSVMDVANNNAGPDGDVGIYMILTWVAAMVDQQEAKWDA